MVTPFPFPAKNWGAIIHFPREERGREKDIHRREKGKGQSLLASSLLDGGDHGDMLTLIMKRKAEGMANFPHAF